MAGRRLLDAAKLFGATRSIAKQHFALRSQQWDVYTRTSTLARAVKNQTDRVTVTARAAYALARRVNEKPPAYTHADAEPATYTTQARQDETSIPRQETVRGAERSAAQDEGLEQDHHYQRSRDNAAVEDPPSEDLGVTQKKAARGALPDGTIPPAGSEVGSSSTSQTRDTFSQRPVSEPPKEPLDDQSHLDLSLIHI